MQENSYKYFKNTECRYYPCHKTEGDYFNCLFCYCPLYMLGEDCGGNFSYNEKGNKVCTDCTVPHTEGGYEHIISKFPQIKAAAGRK